MFFLCSCQRCSMGIVRNTSAASWVTLSCRTWACWQGSPSCCSSQFSKTKSSWTLASSGRGVLGSGKGGEGDVSVFVLLGLDMLCLLCDGPVLHAWWISFMPCASIPKQKQWICIYHDHADDVYTSTLFHIFSVDSPLPLFPLNQNAVLKQCFKVTLPPVNIPSAQCLPYQGHDSYCGVELKYPLNYSCILLWKCRQP